MQNLCLQPARGCHHTASAYLGTAAGRRAADQRQLRGGRQLAPPPARYQRAANVRHNRAGREGTPPSMRARQQRRGLREDRTGTRRAARGSAGSSAHTAAFPAPSSARRPVLGPQPAGSRRGARPGAAPGHVRPSVRPGVGGEEAAPAARWQGGSGRLHPQPRHSRAPRPAHTEAPHRDAAGTAEPPRRPLLGHPPPGPTAAPRPGAHFPNTGAAPRRPTRPPRPAVSPQPHSPLLTAAAASARRTRKRGPAAPSASSRPVTKWRPPLPDCACAAALRKWAEQSAMLERPGGHLGKGAVRRGRQSGGVFWWSSGHPGTEQSEEQPRKMRCALRSPAQNLQTAAQRPLLLSAILERSPGVIPAAILRRSRGSVWPPCWGGHSAPMRPSWEARLPMLRHP